MKQHPLMNQIVKLEEEITEYFEVNKVVVPSEIYDAINREKNPVQLLRDLYSSAESWVGLNIREALSFHFNVGFSVFDEIERWSEEDRNKVETLLIEIVESAKLTAKHDEFFFKCDAEVTADKRKEVLEIYQDIARNAIYYTFSNTDEKKTLYQVNVMKNILRLCEMPETKPNGDIVTVRNLISLDRLKSITSKEKDTRSLEALKELIREWYQNSDYDFLQHREGYHQYNYVPYYLYILTPEQLKQVQEEFIENAERKFKNIKADKWHQYTLSSLRFLKNQVKEILSWEVEVR